MGSYASKLLARYGQEPTEPMVKSSEEVIPSTPTDIKKTLCIDPRSASVGIPRTPIEVTYTPPKANRRPASAIPPYLQKKPYLETDLDNIGLFAPRKQCPSMSPVVGGLSSPILHQLSDVRKLDIPTIDVKVESPPAMEEHQAGDTPVAELRYRILGIDPRSPATDFDRTPILSPKSMRRLKARSQENLARRDSHFELDIRHPRLSYCETISQGSIPEVLALPDIVSNLNKIVNLDSVTKNSDEFDSCSSSSSSSVETISDSTEEITVIRNPNINSMREASTSNIVSSSGSSIEKIDDTPDAPCSIETQIAKQLPGPADNVNRVLSLATKIHAKEQSIFDTEKITVWRDSISSETSETLALDVPKDVASTQNDGQGLPEEQIMIEFDDVEVIKALKVQPTNKYNGTERAKGKKEELTDKKNKIAEVDEKIFFQEKTFASDGKMTNRVTKVRTPLSNRSNNHTSAKGMPMKSPQQLLRGKAMSAHLCQENTPPRSMKSKLNGTQWDPDSTFLI